MVVDHKEVVGKMEPLLFHEGSRHRPALIELVVELVKCSAELRSSLPKGLLHAVADIVRTMNTYYSNLTEGHDTHPVDIEKGLNKNFSENKEQRNLQLLATAHVIVQKWIDYGGLNGQSTTVKGICEVHRRFVEMVPFEMIGKGLNDEIEKFQVVPGELRKADVQVGSHISISPGAVSRFLERFEGVYSQLNTTETILHCAAAHHRLLWIHPFGDGNGRVARLISHAMLLESLETEGVWSIARGLARRESEYKSLLANCDLKRRNDLDGRGNLSEEALAEFTVFFLKTCIDQVQFMKGLLQPEKLLNRIEIWAEEEIRLKTLPRRSDALLKAIIKHGELSRSEINSIVNTSQRHARRITSALIDYGIVVSDSSRSPLRIAIPAKLASRWLPGLFPEKENQD